MRLTSTPLTDTARWTRKWMTRESNDYLTVDRPAMRSTLATETFREGK